MDIKQWTNPEQRANIGMTLPGPWDDEPDKVHWIDPATDLDCLAVRGPMGAWCGYVAVTEGHPWFGLEYGECPEGCANRCYEHSPDARMDVHGDLTFSNFCHEDPRGPGYGICHVPEPGRPDRVWWFGFDCAHAFDLCPVMPTTFAEQTYRTLEYVQGECRRLAAQLMEIAD